MWSGNVKINITKTAILILLFKMLLDCQNPEFIEIPPVLDYLCIAVGMGTFFIKLLFNNFTLKSFLYFMGIGVLLLFTCLEVRTSDLLISFITIYLLKDENFDEYVEMILKAQIVMMIFLFLLMIVINLGNVEQLLWTSHEGRVRFTAGMGHSNLLSSYIFTGIMMYGWLNYEQMTTKKYLLLLLVIYAAFVLTDTRTTLILSIIFVLLLYFAKSSLLQAFYEKCLVFLFPAVAILIGYMVTHFNEGIGWIQTVNDLLTGRIKLGAYAYYRSGITIFPQFLEYMQDRTLQWEEQWELNIFTFDNLYSYLWIQFGIIFVVFFTVVLWKLIKSTDHKCHLFILVWIIYGITEVHGLNSYRCFPVLLLTMMLGKKKEIENQEQII